MGIFCIWKREFSNHENDLLDLEKKIPNFEKVHFLILEMVSFPDLEIAFPIFGKKTADACRDRVYGILDPCGQRKLHFESGFSHFCHNSNPDREINSTRDSDLHVAIYVFLKLLLIDDLCAFYLTYV